MYTELQDNFPSCSVAIHTKQLGRLYYIVYTDDIFYTTTVYFCMYLKRHMYMMLSEM